MAKASLAKIEASRQNALKSTGPKTPAGRAAVRWNALKHGLLSREVVIPAGDGKESKTEYRNLLIRFAEELQPQGILEEMLVEKIAVCYWRLRRVIQCETGEIRKRLDSAVWDSAMEAADEVSHNLKFSMLDHSGQELQKSSVGILYLINVLQDVRAEIEEISCLSDHTRERLIKSFGTEETGLAHTLLIINEMATRGPQMAQENPADFGETPDPAKCKTAMLEFIDTETARLQEIEKGLDRKEEMELESQMLSYRLPAKEFVDRILRYETAIDRQLYRAMDQLERLQRQRQGEIIPPPISIDLSQEN